MFEHHSVYVFSLSHSLWGAVLIPRQMKSIELYVHLKLFQREAYFCCHTRFQGCLQAGNETFCWRKGWYLTSMWFNIRWSLAFCENHGIVLLKGKTKFYQTHQIYQLPSWYNCTAVPACKWCRVLERLLLSDWVQVLLVAGTVGSAAVASFGFAYTVSISFDVGQITFYHYKTLGSCKRQNLTFCAQEWQ